MQYFPRLLLVCLGTTCLAADVNLVEEIVAKVNGDIITRSDMLKARRAAEQELRQRNTPPTEIQKLVTEREHDALRERIDQLLLVQKAKELNLNVDSEFSKYIAELQRESGLAEPDAFHKWISDKAGIRWEDFSQETKEGMQTQRVIRQEVGQKVNIPRDEIKKEYNDHKDQYMRKEQVFLREILISTDKKDAAGIEAAEKKAKDVAARARKGEKFGELARDNSDAQTAKSYGDLGAWKKGELDPKIEAIVFKQERGFVTDPIKVPSGFLILKLEEHYREGQATMEEVEQQIMEKLYMPRMQPALREYLTRLRSEAFLEIKPGYIDSGAAPGKNTAWQDPAQLRPETVTKEQVANAKRNKRALGIPIPGTSASKVRTPKT
jgi:peptidyl-prolyl cis-trans isomerase SurA